MIWKIIILVLIGLYLLGGLVIYFLQEQIIFLPDPTPPDHEFRFRTPFEEKFLKSRDGASLNVLHFKPQGPKGIIVYFHGNAGNLERWGDVVEPFVERGFEVLIMDYRGYGKSTGNRTKAKMLTDSEFVYAEAQKDWKENQIIVYGRSLGSSFASHIGGKFHPSKVILEAPFHSVNDMARRMLPIYPTSWLLRFNFNNEKSLVGCQTSVSIFHGDEDDIVPFDSGKKLFDRISCEKNFNHIKGGGHNDLGASNEYWSKIDELLNQQTVK